MNPSGTPKQRALVATLILIGLIVIAVFGWRTARAIREFRGHRPPPPLVPAAETIETDVSLIRDWMTIPFISKMYHVPSHKLFQALDVPEHRNKEKSLKQLNDEYYPEAEGFVLEIVQATILANQPHPAPTDPGTPTLPVP